MGLSFGNTVLRGVCPYSLRSHTNLLEGTGNEAIRTFAREAIFFSGLYASWMNFRVFERPSGRTALVILDWVEFPELESVYVNDCFDVNR